jgi:hypothetical protein
VEEKAEVDHGALFIYEANEVGGLEIMDKMTENILDD